MAEINFDRALAYDAKHDIASKLTDAFESRGGGCGHDLGITGTFAIIEAWEKIRTEEKVRDLEMLKS